jgi:hypothetical protein
MLEFVGGEEISLQMQNSASSGGGVGIENASINFTRIGP